METPIAGPENEALARKVSGKASPHWPQEVSGGTESRNQGSLQCLTPHTWPMVFVRTLISMPSDPGEQEGNCVQSPLTFPVGCLRTMTSTHSSPTSHEPPACLVKIKVSGASFAQGFLHLGDFHEIPLEVGQQDWATQNC